MTLTLRLTNVAALADGGPVSYSTDGKPFEFGRDPAMDWTLPDPQRFVSSCHGQVRIENGGYYLYDMSTNGTFVNGSAARVKSPYPLQQGDRIQVGTYIVLVEKIKTPKVGPAIGEAGGSSAPIAQSFGGGDGDIWSVGAPPSAPLEGFDPRPVAPPPPDFGDQHIEIPAFGASPPSPSMPMPVPVPTPVPPPAPPASLDAHASPFGAAPTPIPSADPLPSAAVAAPLPPVGPAPTPIPTPSPPLPQNGVGAAEAAPTPPVIEPIPTPSHNGSVAQPGPPLAASIPGAPGASAGLGFDASPQARAKSRPPLETPLPEPVPTPEPPPPSMGATSADTAALLRTIAEGAGLRPDAFVGTDPHAAAHEIGRALRIMTAELTALLRVRTTIKTSFRSGSRTEMSAEANNPLKFIPTAEEALETMFGKVRPGYQRGADAVQASFADITRHQVAVFAAIQPALAEVLGDLAPEAIESKVEAGPFSNKAAKSWELFIQRWDAKTAPHDNGMLDVFNLYFARAYDQEVNGKK